MQNFFRPIQQLTNDDISPQDLPEEKQLEQNEPKAAPKAQISPRHRRRKRKQIDDLA